jgi:hypothetical protein
MKAKNVLMICVILAMAVIFTACAQVGPTDPDRVPKSSNVRVEYLRVLPVPTPQAMDDPTLGWSYDSNQGGASNMTKIAEDSFSVSGISIMTETKIRIWVRDPRMWNGTSLEVCKTLKIDGQELEVGSIYGTITFIKGNDGKIRKPGG